MPKKELKIIGSETISSCKSCTYCKTISATSKIYYCREFKNVIFDFFKFPEYCEFESIFKTIRKVG